MTTSQLTFEEAINKLELIVNEMENNETPLELALSKYQEGISLIKQCQNQLQDAKQRIQILDPNNNSLKDFAINES